MTKRYIVTPITTDQVLRIQFLAKHRGSSEEETARQILTENEYREWERLRSMKTRKEAYYAVA